ncbi:hypothetical protein MPSEU_000621200 [Mayamaea pseudoterrestris]|nr:hypothetical protein MPSEU_000621200 [Mayamaea pseudoterrestris]
MISTAAHDSFRNSLDPETQQQLHMSLQESLLNSQLQHFGNGNLQNHHVYQQQHQQQQTYPYQNVDFAKVFDNDDLNQLFYESFKHDSLEPTPMAGGAGLSKSNSLDGLALLCNSTNFGSVLQQQQQVSSSLNNNNYQSSTHQVAAPASNPYPHLSQANATFDSNVSASPYSSNNGNNNASNNPFVNVMLIVDPATQKVICPRQTLQYQVGQVMEHHVVGPSVLDNVNASQGLDIQQLIQQGVFHNSLNASQLQGLFGTGNVSHSVTPPPPTSDLVSSSSSSASATGSNNDKSSNITEATTASTLPVELPPLRALSAYNFFFRDERDRVLNGGSQELDDTKASQLLHEHWGRDRTKKRRHRKTHGKIDFTTLSKLISSRWKELSEQDKEFYRQVAAKDWERYQKELGEHKNKSHQAHLAAHQAVVDNHLAVVA